MKSPEEKKRDNQRFIQEKIDPVIRRMLLELTQAKPHNVVSIEVRQMKFMAEWIYKEQNPDFIEKALNDLPRTYGKPHLNNKDFDMSLHSQTPNTLSRKTTQKDGPNEEFEMRSLSRKKEGFLGEPPLPGDELLSSARYRKPELQSDEEEEEEVADLDSFLKDKKLKTQTDQKVPRQSVSAEVYGKFNKKENFVPRYNHKSAEEKRRIKEKLRETWMFRGLDEKDMEIIADAMSIKRCRYSPVKQQRRRVDKARRRRQRAVLGGFRHSRLHEAVKEPARRPVSLHLPRRHGLR